MTQEEFNLRPVIVQRSLMFLFRQPAQASFIKCVLGYLTKLNLGQFPGGNNGNGSCYKFPNGLQICRFTISVPANSTVTWTFLLAFISQPQITITAVTPASAVPSAKWGSAVSVIACSVFNPNTAGTNANLIALL